jgi:stage V sporulation protein R
VGFHEELSLLNRPQTVNSSKMLDYYFDVFLQTVKKVQTTQYIKEIERYNQCIEESRAHGEKAFFSTVLQKYPEFDALYQKSLKNKRVRRRDVVQFIIDQSDYLNKEENRWMKPVVQVVRKTSLFFQPQIRTKIMNEGWASYWHEHLFLKDDRIEGHEVDFARTHAGVTSMPRVGLNPYALGLRLFYYIKDLTDKGKYSLEFRKLKDTYLRDKFDTDAGTGEEFIFKLRENLNDFLFISTFVDQDFINQYKLFVAGRRLNQARGVWEYYIKSRSAEDYRQMLIDGLYHPPHISVDEEKSKNGELYLTHHFEGKPLVQEYISNTMLGIEYLWGAPVHLETSVVSAASSQRDLMATIPGFPMPRQEEPQKQEIKWQRVKYTMKDRKLSKVTMATGTESDQKK